MDQRQIKNLPEPTDEMDVVNKKYVDKILPKERIYKFLGTSIILIRGEAKGPIIGMEEVQNSNKRIIADLGRLPLDKDNKLIKPTIVYFGKYESAIVDSEVHLNGVLTEIQTKISPNYLIPFRGSIFNISFTFTSLDKSFIPNREPIFAVLRYNTGEWDERRGDGVKEDTLNLSTGIFENSGTKQYQFGRNFLVGGRESKQYRACFNLPKDEIIHFEECTSLYLYFIQSLKDIDSIFITIAAQIYFPDYNEDYFPQDFDI